MKRGKAGAGASELRRKAERVVAKRRAKRPGARSSADAQRMLHELEVHQVELEMQNDDLREARLEMERGLERYTLLFDFAPTGYAILAPGGTIREINHVGASLLGRERSRLVGKPFEAFLVPEDRLGLELRLVEALDHETTEVFEARLAKRGEVPLVAQLTARALTRGERMVLLAFEDITERKQRDVARDHVEETLRETHRRKDEFLASLGHELRNPLAPIRTSLSLLGGRRPNDERANKARDIIERQVRHLTRLVDDLLDVTRIAHGKLRLERKAADLVPLVRRTLDDHRATFEASGIGLEAQLAPAELCADVDAERFVQALVNVLGNALKFTPKKGTVTVVVERSDHDEVAVRVRDTGAGIEPEVLAHLFEPFVQGSRTVARSRGGLGLGLATVKGLLELQGGTVGATSAGPGRGTEITLRLPLLESSGAARTAPLAPRASHGRRVLVIEDNVDHGESLQLGLERSGHEVRLARSARTGLELARRLRPDVIVSDISLPGGMDGYALARAVRSDPSLRDTYLVALSGYTRPEDLERALDAGFDRHLGKPAPLEELDDLINEAPVTRLGDHLLSETPPDPPH